VQVHTNLQLAEARLALLEAQVATTAAPGAAANAHVVTNIRQSAAESHDGLSSEADVAAADHGVMLAPQRCDDWAAGAGDGLTVGVVANSANNADDAAFTPEPRP
jgi:hypothetical protein